MYLCRAVDVEGEILHLLVWPRRDKAATLRLVRKLLKKRGFVPVQIVTDNLNLYSSAK